MVNTPMLLQELQFITRNKAHHNQGDWFTEYPDNACKTAGCLAGWTAIHHAKDQLLTTKSEAWIAEEDRYVPVLMYGPKNGSWSGLGKELLGLDWDQADELFEASNTIWDLWNLASVITNGEIQIPEEVEAMRKEKYNRTEGEDYSWLAEGH